MKTIRDERLEREQLKNIRIAFFVQSIGIIFVLLYEGLSGGVKAVIENPLWIIFLLSILILNILNLRISVDLYDHFHKKLGLKFGWIIISSLLAGIVAGFVTKFGPDQASILQSILAGVIVFICLLVPFTITYFLLKKRMEN